MDRNTKFQAINHSLQAPNIAFANATVNNLPAAVGYIKEFRASWMFTQLNTFVLAAEMPHVELDDIRGFTNAAFAHALSNNRGWPRGLQAAIAALPCLVCDTASEAAKAFVTSSPQKHWSAFELPSIYETSTGTLYTYAGTPLWGAVYFAYFKKLVSTHFGATTGVKQ